MKLVLDTHILLWWLANSKRLSSKARQLIENPSNAVGVSSASVWEIAVKHALGRIDINLGELEEAISESGFEPLDIKMRHAAAISDLPLNHRDPFDRMLIAQCLIESAHLVTNDASLIKYGKVVMAV